MMADDNAGGAIGLYPNGLRVIRDISPELLATIRGVGYPYIYRRWMRHDGTQVACASESVLCPDEPELQSIGVRRWKLQNALCGASRDQGIPIVYGKRLRSITQRDARAECVFEDDTRAEFDIVFGADGLILQRFVCLDLEV
jgi:salicylate hydroxylase